MGDVVIWIAGLAFISGWIVKDLLHERNHKLQEKINKKIDELHR